MYKTETINEVKVRPIKVPQIGDGKFKGLDLFSEPYANIFLVGRKKSGKSSTIFKILQECCGKRTVVVIFCSTLHKDASWIHMQEWMDKKGIKHIGYTSLESHLQDLLDFLKRDNKEDDDATAKAPEYMFIFDDIGGEIREKSVNELLKTNRHFKAKVIISSQNLKDIQPAARRQIDAWLLFPKLSVKVLADVHEAADLPITVDQFSLMYHQATEQPYHFLYFSSAGNDYRINFNEKIKI